VIFGGPSDTGRVVGLAHAAELVATNPIAGSLDELVEIGPFLYPTDSADVGQITIFQLNSLALTGARVHRVGPGETLYSIASLYHVDQKELVKTNKNLVEPLIVGDEMIIPQTQTEYGGAGARRVAGAYLPAGFAWPVRGKIVFGPPHGKYGGLDFPGPLGSPIIAAGAGTIIAADYGWNGGYGNRVIIDHGDGLYTLYGHLDSMVAAVGSRVAQGETVGFMGSTGRSTGPHLHFEVRWL